jgi:hypothetical protein
MRSAVLWPQRGEELAVTKQTIKAALIVAGALVFVTSAVARSSAPIHGKIIGHFGSASSCFGCGDMVKYVRADRVWCAWLGDNVIIHVRFRNLSVDHVTIHWHPSYVIRGGGSHGEGFSSLQDSGVNAHASRGVYVKQKPKGVPAGSPLSVCKPSFSSVESG